MPQAQAPEQEETFIPTPTPAPAQMPVAPTPQPEPTPPVQVPPPHQEYQQQLPAQQPPLPETRQADPLVQDPIPYQQPVEAPPTPPEPNSLTGDPYGRPAALPPQLQPSQKEEAPPLREEAREIPEAIPHRSHVELTPKAKSKSRIPSILFIIAFMIIAGACIFGVMSLMGILDIKPPFFPGDKGAPPVQVGSPIQQIITEQEAVSSTPQFTEQPQVIPEPSSPEPITPSPPAEFESAPTPPPTPTTTPSSQPAELPPGEDYREGETPLPSGLDLSQTNDPEAIQTHLTHFLSAGTLEQRSNTIASNDIKSENLAESILSGPLPRPTNITYLTTSQDRSENRTDFFFLISWDEGQKAPSKPITVELHRWSQSDPPQIHSQAFIQAYEEEIAQFASVESDELRRFHILGRCIPKCFESSIPGASQKATLNIASFPKDGRPIKAYFPKSSELLTRFKKEINGRAMSNVIPLTVTLAWSDSKVTPRYLELVKVDAFDWHP